MLRADLHVHSRHSRPCSLGRLRDRRGPGTPDEIERAARARGMDLFTLTDRDTIDGCLEYAERHPGAEHFFMSEEVTARDPRHGARLQVLVYGIDEVQHRELARRRHDVRDLLAYARAEGIAASLGPWFCERQGAAPPEAFVRETLGQFELFEIANGAFNEAHHRMTLRLAHEARARSRFGVTGGSGAHGPSRAGRTGTAAEADSRAGFLRALREGRASVIGQAGSRWASVADLLRVLGEGDGRLALGAPALIRHAVNRTRLGARLRSGHRTLDQAELRRFREKIRSYRSGSGAESDSTRAAGHRAPSSHQASITTLE